ncbi:amino acid permease [Entomobacter blattae]|uniref:Putative amino acid permease YhdG n=1 Tax=Entomobacter blattae TaxID=2762277 RepID=A0A7H1NT08_9PROT|nr:amino acid permease [Entomobacter blattae]QNT78918.1 putative amino acid permease YhdG [Entomobacter blattae]
MPQLGFLRTSLAPLFRRKSITERGLSTGLKRNLTAKQLLALGVGATIGAGLFSITGVAAAENAGPAVALAYLLGAIVCSFIGLCYSELASMIPIVGSAYTYTYIALGELAAWVIGWDLIMEYAVGAAIVAVSWSRYVGSILHSWGVYFPVKLTASPFETVTLSDGSVGQGIINLPAILVICCLSLVLIRGISHSTRLNTVMVIIKLLVIVLVICFGFYYIKPANYIPFIPENTGEFGHFGYSGILRAAATTFFAYIGFDAVSTVTQEAKNPSRDMPIGILGSLAVCAVVYITFSLILTGLVNYKDMLNDAAPVATAIDQTSFPWLKVAVKLGVLCGFTSVLLVMLLAQSRIFYSMAKDGLLPRLFSEVHHAWQTPWRSNMFFMVMTSLLAGFLPIGALGRMISIGTLLAFGIVCFTVLILRFTMPDIKRPFRVPGGIIIPILGIFSCLLMMLSLGVSTWSWLVIWLAVGIALYFCYGYRHSRLRS